jgi:crotonobetaine/carnitine-CoA ligase
MKLKNYELKASTIRDLIRLQSSLGDKPMAIVDDEAMSYRGAHETANRIANSMLEMGIGKGDVVASYLYNSIDHICLWFACAKIGAIWAPFNIALVNIDLAHTINEVAPRMIVIDAPLMANYLQIRDQVARPDMTEVFRGGDAPDASWRKFEDLRLGAPEEPEADIRWSDPAGLIFTGGSTGLPKGILVSNAWYFPGVLRYLEMLGPKEDDVHIGLGQMYHTIGSAVDILSPFYFGMTTVMTRWFSASRFFDTARRHNCTLSVIIGPTLLALLAQPEREDDGDNPIRIAATGTGGLPREKVDRFMKRFGIDLVELYGQTETGPLGCVGERVDDRPYYSLGKTHGWVDVMVADKDGVPCPAGTIGEILIRPLYPSTFMLGYFNRPDRQAEACRDLWFHSSDLGHLDEQGYLHFDGRMAHMIRRRGESIAAVEVEAVVLSHPAVKRCAVVGVPSDMGDEEVKVSIELHASAHCEPIEIVKYCEERIAYFKVPRYVEMLSELPMTPTKGEIERHKLQASGVTNAWDRELAGYKVRRRVEA